MRQFKVGTVAPYVSATSRLQAKLNAGGTVRLPNGPVYLDVPLVVPAGVSVTIQGGYRTSLRRSRNFVGVQLLVVGTESPSGTVFTTSGSPAEGATSLPLASGSLTNGHWYVYRGTRRARGGADVAASNLQIVDQGLLRGSGASTVSTPVPKAVPSVITLQRLVNTPNVILRNFTVDGDLAGQPISQGIYFAGATDFLIEDVEVRNFSTQGIYVKNCHTGTIRRVHTENPYTTNPLRYGIEINGSTGIEIENPSTRGTRKVTIFTCGSALCNVLDGRSYGPVDNPFDTHGTGSHKIRFVRCIAEQGTMIVGNPTWRIGDTEVSFEDCEAPAFVIGPNCRATLDRCRGKELLLMCAMSDSVNDAVRCPQQGPLRVEATDCSFVNPAGVPLATQDWYSQFNPTRRFGELVATRTRFEGTFGVGYLGDNSNVIPMLDGKRTSVEFYNCEFKSYQNGIILTGASLVLDFAFDGGQAWGMTGAVLAMSGTVSGTQFLGEPLNATGSLIPVTSGGSLTPGGVDPRNPELGK